MKKLSIVSYLDKKFFPSYKDNWDDEIFREHICQVVDQNKSLLDLGAGAGIVREMNFKGIAKRVVGVDPDSRVLQNPYLDEAFVGTGEQLPLEDCQFDVVISDNVFEHIADPEAVLSEIFRVLKPGGYLLVKTPNKFHYMPLIARLTPSAFHKWFNNIRGRKADDTFKTLYKCNSRKEFAHFSRLTGFIFEKATLIEGRPEYLRVSSITYLFGIAYSFLVNLTPFLEIFRILLIARLRKPEVE